MGRELSDNVNQIEKEIAELAQKLESNPSPILLNNFDDWLHEGHRRIIWNRGIISDEDFFKKDNSVSEIKRTKTVSEFFQDCDNAVAKAGYTPDDIVIERNIFESESHRDYNNCKRLFTFLLPVYKELRIMGYEHLDLTR